MNRKFLLKTTLLGVTGMAGLALAEGISAALEERKRVEVTKTRVPFKDLPTGLEGLRIVHLSDLHHGRFISLSYLRRCVEAVGLLRPDLVAVTGDFITGGVNRFMRPAAALLASLDAPLGVYAVPGNHEYGVPNGLGVPRRPGYGRDSLRILREEGLPLLRNESRTLRWRGETVHLIGIDDLWARKASPRKAFRGLPERGFRLLLAHNPDTLERLEGYRFDLMLSGHTHGGQFRFPLLGTPVLPVRNRRHVSGLYPAGGGWLYVNRGLGCLPPGRINVPPEISLIVLRNDKDTGSGD